MHTAHVGLLDQVQCWSLCLLCCSDTFMGHPPFIAHATKGDIKLAISSRLELESWVASATASSMGTHLLSQHRGVMV